MSVRQIAKQMGISASAVSLAMRGSPKISEATRRKVKQIAKTIGYHPSAKLTELMSQVRTKRQAGSEGCFALVSLHEHPRPWQLSKHLAGIHASMQERAEDLGYRLDPLWIRAPGMNYRRCRSILDARNIQGPLCFGSPLLDDQFPAELDHYAVVTVGLSIKT